MILYRLLVTLIAPLLLVRLAWRVLRGAEGRDDLAQRLGRGAPLPGQGPVVWLHGASNGELASVRGLAQALIAARPDARLVVSANTVTGRALAATWPMTARAVLAPIDTGGAVRRFLTALRPDLVIVVENELWPNRLAALAARGVPVALVGARMSARSAARWHMADRLFGGLIRRLLGGLALVSAQDAASAARLAGLGAPEGAVVDLKASVPAGRLPPMTEARARVVLAASTHAGDEARIARALAPVLARQPGLRLILAPRHPSRAPQILAELSALGLAVAQRSAGAGAAAPVYLADTLGEMHLWYAQAGLCVIGGSFGDLGGHTPHEPLAQGCAVLHGPDMGNFAAAAQALAPTGALVADDVALARRLAELVGQRDALAGLAAAQAAALTDLRGDPTALVAALGKLLRTPDSAMKMSHN